MWTSGLITDVLSACFLAWTFVTGLLLRIHQKEKNRTINRRCKVWTSLNTVIFNCGVTHSIWKDFVFLPYRYGRTISYFWRQGKFPVFSVVSAFRSMILWYGFMQYHQCTGICTGVFFVQRREWCGSAEYLTRSIRLVCSWFISRLDHFYIHCQRSRYIFTLLNCNFEKADSHICIVAFLLHIVDIR
jgi:hypothetical protein